MDRNNENPTNIPEPANFKPSRFLEKKQQALLLQAQRLHSIKTSEEPTHSRFVFTANETQDRVRSFSATQKKEDFVINTNPEKKINEPNLLEKKVETKQKTKWNFTKMNLENWNYSKKDLNKKDKMASKNQEGVTISDKIFQPVSFPSISKQETNLSNAALTITETLQNSLFSNKLVLFQMPQNLPFLKSNKKKMSMTLPEPDPENEDEILAYLMREKLDSMGNELNSEYTSILKTEEESKKKEELQSFQFGKLRIYSDNTAEIIIGEHSFELSNSIDTQFFQEMCGLEISGLKPSLYCLGQVEKKIVCKPKLNSIIEGI